MLQSFRGELLVRSGASLAHGRSNSPARRSNLLVAHAAGALLKFIDAVSGKDRMRMRIDKARQNNAAARINNLRVSVRASFDLFRSRDTRNDSVAHEHPAIGDNPELTQLAADAWPFRPGKRDELRRIENGNVFHRA